MGKVKATEVKKGQKVRVDSNDGPKEGTVHETKKDEHKGKEIVWITVRTGESSFIDSMHEPGDSVEVLD